MQRSSARLLLVPTFGGTILFAEVLHKVMAYEIAHLIGDNFPNFHSPGTSRGTGSLSKDYNL